MLNDYHNDLVMQLLINRQVLDVLTAVPCVQSVVNFYYRFKDIPFSAVLIIYRNALLTCDNKNRTSLPYETAK